MIKEYLEHHFEPNPNDEFKMEPPYDASLSRRVSGLPVLNSNPPALAGGCLVKEGGSVGLVKEALEQWSLKQSNQGIDDSDH